MTRETSSRGWAFHNIRCGRILVARTKRGIVCFHRSNERIACAPQARGLLRFARPQNNLFFAPADLHGHVTPRNHEGIPVVRSLGSEGEELSVPSRSFRPL